MLLNKHTKHTKLGNKGNKQNKETFLVLNRTLMSGFREHSTTAQPAKQKTPTRLNSTSELFQCAKLGRDSYCRCATETVVERHEDHGIKTMKLALLSAVQKHFSDVEQNSLFFSTATLLNPR